MHYIESVPHCVMLLNGSLLCGYHVMYASDLLAQVTLVGTVEG